MKRKIPLFVFLLSGCLLFYACGKNIDDGGKKETTLSPAPTGGESEEPDLTKEPEPTKEPEISLTPAKDELESRPETEEYLAKEGDAEVFVSKISYPVFTGGKADTDALNAFVESLIEEFRAYLPEAEEGARLDYEDFGESGLIAFPESAEFTITVVGETKEWISIHSTWYGYGGGPHPNTYCKAYVRKKADGSEVSIEEYLEQYRLTPEEVADYAAEQVRAVAEEDMFWDEEGLPDSFLRILKENQWYFTDEGIVLFADPYELAAYVYGKIECKISYEVLRQGLKNQ
ncbi:MAG: DUF3298 and DUF4163 domain-containing protein [Lachnospiraceae bacterium]|nr:DUF3298 and DUF4163 domain-containing protein [Lachnospiraceae bacterium]